MASLLEEHYLEFADFRRVPDHDGFLVETHVPTKFSRAYHHHASVEVNYLIGCEMEYSFSGRVVRVPRHTMIVFWGAAPHGVVDVRGEGRIINIYISLAQALRWAFPKPFIEAIIGGSVLSGTAAAAVDDKIFPLWAEDYSRAGAPWRQLLRGEIETRLRRMALEGYDVLLDGAGASVVDVAGRIAMKHTESMLRFIADSYAEPITVPDVAAHAGLSPSYAMSLFRRTVGVTIKEHITRIRLSHAQMLLANSDLKIISVAMDSGFNSLSSFYDAFQTHVAKTPAAFRNEAGH